MSGPRRSFTWASATEEPIVFDLGGDPYEVHRPVQGMVLLDFALATSEGDDAAAIGAVVAFQRLLGDDWPRFHDEAMRRGLDGFQLAEVLQWIVEQVSERPTPPPSDSPASRSNGGPSSTAPLPSEAST